jgi:lipoate-protein ligase A
VPRAWRLLLDGEASGPWNMGVDEALLASAIASGRSSLRLYRWSGPWLSLGYGQRPGPERLAACTDAGVGVVRRVTGGGAVLHGGDLTYAIAAPEAVLPPGLRATYQLIGAALRSALLALGIDAQSAPGAAAARRRGSFDCFSEAAGDELCAGGRKLVGSAQRRARGGVLQHGSIRVFPDPEPLRAAAGLDAGSATSLRELACEQPREALEKACVACFSRVLGVRFEPGSLDAGEERIARERTDAHRGDPIAVPVIASREVSRAHPGGR